MLRWPLSSPATSLKLIYDLPLMPLKKHLKSGCCLGNKEFQPALRLRSAGALRHLKKEELDSLFRGTDTYSEVHLQDRSTLCTVKRMSILFLF